eukprot:TRINITY_DN300_c0_g1_i5.p1 TRINITY_DN300_c0_g1~~TRINITY_DN300_c0_g1_i5.p1  ORF type:complete len:416 (+),score=52.04 TRINITY_DN300_c0_g1_i5:62-1309(+)
MQSVWTVKNTFVNVEDDDSSDDMPMVGRLRSLSDPLATASGSDAEYMGKEGAKLSDRGAESTTDDEGSDGADGQTDGTQDDQISLPDTELDASDMLNPDVDAMMFGSMCSQEVKRELQDTGVAPTTATQGNPAGVAITSPVQPLYVFCNTAMARSMWMPVAPLIPQHQAYRESATQYIVQPTYVSGEDSPLSQPNLRSERHRCQTQVSDVDCEPSCSEMKESAIAVQATDQSKKRQQKQSKPQRMKHSEKKAGEVHDDTRPSSTKEGVADVPEEQRTTVMLRNFPNNYTSSMVVDLLDSEGFAGTYDFIYLPIDFSTCSSLGYAFVNFLEPKDARRVWAVFDGFSQWVVPSKKKCSISWSEPTQGLQANIERYRNSPVMHESVPEDFRPLLMQDGARIPFPAPTRKIRVPRLKRF